jgi:predicted transcriptional regulator
MVGQAMQKLSAAQRKSQREKNPSSQISSLTPLSKVLTSDQIENIKKMAKDPAASYQIKTALGLT